MTAIRILTGGPAEHFEGQTMYWLPKLLKKPIKYRFISASSKCTTTKISVLSTSALNTIKRTAIKRMNYGINYFWSVNNFLCVLYKLLR